MPGGITETGELYSPYVGLVYMFNLIVGTGALTMPQAFAEAGWAVSLALIIFLAFMSYMTTTFVIEAMAAANAHLRWKRRERQRIVDDSDASSDSYDDDDKDEIAVRDGYERSETRPILSVQRASTFDAFDIVERIEMGQMASMFFNKDSLLTWGSKLMHSPSTAVDIPPQFPSGLERAGNRLLTSADGRVASSTLRGPDSILGGTWAANAFATEIGSCCCAQIGGISPSFAARRPLKNFFGENPAQSTVRNCRCFSIQELAFWIGKLQMYCLKTTAFSLLLGPFTFFNVQKTKYLQIITSLMRWIAFIIMIILALIRISKGGGEGHPPVANFSGIPNLFGVCVYSFMCQHSLPSLITPISKKKHVIKLVLVDYVLILAFYSLLAFTAIFCFSNLKDMYTLNFTSNCDVVSVPFIRYFLGLFPVFTISTNFPIIAVTLRNNWKTVFHRDGGMYPWLIDRVVFPLITIIPAIVVAFCTHDLETLVGITGSYAGTGIQYIIPACLVYFSRKDVGLVFGNDVQNKYRSPFKHTFWVIFVLVWSISCFIFVTTNIVLTETKP
uniref:transmembrane protein 104 n=1 Tax=Pristiophorus japonicus TaxID=55135 RepID=UPI00398EA098